MHFEDRGINSNGNWSLYTSLCACRATLSCSQFFRSSLNNAIAASFSSMACRCFSWIFSILTLNPCGTYDVFQDVLLKCLFLVFSRVYSDIKATGQRHNNIISLGVFPREVHTMNPPFSLEEGRRSYIFF